MKRYLIMIIGFIAICTMFGACQEDFLDRSPLDQITSADFFTNPNDLKVYMNQFYTTSTFPLYGWWGNDFDSDNSIGELPNTRLEGTRLVRNTGGLGFDNIRRINYFFNNYKVIEEYAKFDDYKQYVGEGHFFRALYYFGMLRDYGDIQWITKELGTDSEELYKARDSRNIVADNIISQLDSAAMYLQEAKTDGSSRINKWMALLLQSRVALYEGCWEKYHNGTVFGVDNPQSEKYFNKAVEATSQIMNSGLYDIYSTGNPHSDYFDLYSVIKDFSGNSEVMFYQKMDKSIGEFYNNSCNRNYRMIHPIGRSYTKGLADSYLCADGKIITESPLFKGHATLNDEFQNRDPRMLQSFAPPDAVRRIAADGTPMETWQWVYDRINQGADFQCPAGYIIRKGCDPDETNIIYNNEENPSIVYRYAEVLLNYAEAKAELGALTQEDVNKTIKKLRDRVDMPNLILDEITTDPNWNFPELSPVINEVRRERRVELVGEGHRWDDIARWAAADELIVGMRPIGATAAQYELVPYPVDEDGFLDPYQNILPNGYEFDLGRDYLTSIPIQEIVLNPNMEQNPGWESN